MKVVWSKNPILACEVIASLSGARKWHPKTVRTFLARLVRKGALAFDRQGRAYRYRPLVGEAGSIQVESESFLQRVFGGAVSPMLAYFVEKQKISKSDLKELKRLLR